MREPRFPFLRSLFGAVQLILPRPGGVVEVRCAADPSGVESFAILTGSLQNPPDEESLVRKFIALSENILGKERSHRATETILTAEKISDLKALLIAVSTPSKPG